MTQPIAQDRLVAKEVALGTIREYPQPEGHIGLSLIAPFKSVESDDVIFDYTQGLLTGLAPARAEDAEAELAQKDESVGYGRASVIDWAIKDHYDASDVTRFREALLLGQTNTGSFPLTIGSMTDGFAERLARDTLIRRRKLDNRLEWLIMKSLENGEIDYDDGKVKFTVDWGRPGGNSTTVGTLWSSASSDPINDVGEVQDAAWDDYSIRLTRGIASQKVIRNILNSDKFAARSGFAGAGNPDLNVDPRYLIDGWGFEAARAVFERATGVTLIPYDAVYRVRGSGSSITNKRFLSDDKVILLPSPQDIEAVDDTVGFAATLTSPHPEGNWQTGYYEWERSTVDPWGYDTGTGIKAFPVFPHLEWTYTLTVL